MARLGQLNISFIVRRATKRGPTSSLKWNDSFEEISNDFTSLYNEWNNYLYPLLLTVPDGTDDTSVDAFTNGLDGDNLYANADATAISNPTYYDSINARPYTIFEQLQELYTYVDGINATLSGSIAGVAFSAASISVQTDTVPGLSDESNTVQAALIEIATDVDSFLTGTSYLPLSGGLMTGPIGIGGVDATLSSSVQIVKGTGTPESVVTAPVGSMYVDTDGGVGSTLYIKETGAGSSGWASK